MSITSADDRVTSYNPVVATTNFAADFPVFDLADISVYVDGVERFDFTPAGTFTDGISNNATAIFSSGITGAVQVVGVRDPHRTNRFSNGGPLPISSQNLALDTVEAELQEARRDISRGILAPIGTTGLTLSSDIDDGDTLMKQGNSIVKGPDAAEISSAQEYAEDAHDSQLLAKTYRDQASAFADFARNNWVAIGPFVGTGNEADYLLTIDPGSANNMLVVVGGVAQLITGSAYALVYSGGNPYIRITVPDGIPFEVRLSNAININTPADGTVSTAKIANDAVTYAKMQNISATLRLLGRASAGAGDPEELTAAQLRDLFLPSGSIIDRVVGTYVLATVLTAQIPVDDTIPQSSEGTQIISVSITPKSTTNKLRIRFSGWGSASGLTTLIWSLFNGGTNAIAAGGVAVPSSGYLEQICGEVEYTPGVVTAQTISLRVGPSSAVNAMINGSAASRYFGGSGITTLTVEEIKG
jgi:hypothetical protein